MLKTLQLITALLIVINSTAQREVDASGNSRIVLQVVSGFPMPLDKYVSVVGGSPFFREDWLTSNIVSGGEKKQVAIKLDLLANQIHYQNEKGEELIAETPIKQMVLTDNSTSEKFKFVHSSTIKTEDKLAEGWYQELGTGKVSLYKFYKKYISEKKPLGSATTEQTIHTFPQFHLLVDGKLIHVKKFKDLQEQLADKSKEVRSHISAKGINGKSDDDFINVVSMYNNLFGQDQ